MSVAEFFVAPNRVEPDAGNPDGQLALRAIAEPDAIMVLPWDDGHRGARWYVLVHEDRLEQVREEVVAHAGITYTDYRGQATSLESEDPGDEAVARVCADRAVIRLDLVDNGGRRRVARALGRFLDLWDIRPPPPAPPTRAAAEILRDYRLALAAGHRSEAEAAVIELRASGGLEVVNLHFLEFEIISKFEGPVAVLDHPVLPTLLQIRRPARVSDLIARAVDRARLRRDGPVGVDLVCERFEELDSLFRELITTPGECRSASGALLLALRTSSTDGDIAAVVERLNRLVEFDDSTSSLLSALTAARRGRGTPPPEGAARASLGELLSRGEYDRVLELVGEEPPTASTVEAALRAAQWLDSIDAGRVALRVLEKAPAEVRGRFVGNRLIAPMVEALRELVRADAPRPEVRNWNEFFENLWSEPSWAEAVETAAHGVVEWPAHPFLNDRDAVGTLASHIARGANSGVVTFTRVIPHVIDWLDRVPDDARPATIDIEEALLVQLALEDQTRAGLDLLGSFAADVIAAGLGIERYRFVLDNLQERWSRAKSPAAIAWVADLIEAVIDHQCPDDARRTALASFLLQTSAEFVSRISVDMRTLLWNLAAELALQDLLPAVPVEAQIAQTEARRDTRGLVVGLYSLTESALQRARDHLTSCWPGLDVVTRADRVGSDELANLARTADLMVVVTRSAKHAATEFISDHRPPRLATRFAKGKGSASLVREVEEWLDAG